MLLKNKYLLISIFVIALLCFNIDVMAQCPMCRVSAETNLENGGTEGSGLNKGILYLLAIPYVLIFVIGYTWWKNNKKQKSLEE